MEKASPQNLQRGWAYYRLPKALKQDRLPSPKKALRAADVPVEHNWSKTALQALGDGKGEAADVKSVEPAGKWECMKMLFSLLMKIFGEGATQAASDSGQFRAPDSGQFRGE